MLINSLLQMMVWLQNRLHRIQECISVVLLLSLDLAVFLDDFVLSQIEPELELTAKLPS